MTIHHIPTTTSLMDDMRLPHLVQLDAHMVVLTTDYQSAGRGQHTHHWESAPSENLLLGIIVHPSHYLPSQQKQLSDDVAAAVCRAVSPWLSPAGLTAWVKQPNDIYVGRLKLAGLLIEHDIQSSRILTTRIGLGLNVNQDVFHSSAPNPCSLRTLLGHPVPRHHVLTNLIQEIEKALTPPSLDK